MNYNQFNNLSCYEEFEIQCALTGISKIDVLKEIIGHRIDDYYFFISEDGVFNWFDLEGNHIENPGVLKTLDHSCISYDITKCVIPNSVTSIGKYTFDSCILLKEITIPDSVTSIGKYAFRDCASLTSITIPNSVTRIGNMAFSFCKALKEITISNSVTYIDNCVFYGCISLEEITIPNSVTNIGDDALFCCNSLKQVIFKGKTLDEVKRMENYPFGINCSCLIKCET